MPRKPSSKALRLLQELFNGALNYRSRREKELFGKLFLQTSELKQCLAPSIYFLVVFYCCENMGLKQPSATVTNA